MVHVFFFLLFLGFFGQIFFFVIVILAAGGINKSPTVLRDVPLYCSHPRC